MIVIGDDGVEFDDGVDESGGEPEDRGDNLDEILEVDEEIVAELAKDDVKTAIEKDKLDSIFRERRVLQEKVQELEAKLAAGVAVPAPAAAPVVEEAGFDLDAKEAAYAEALTEGDLDSAAVIRKEIRTFEHESMLAAFRKEQAEMTVQATVQTKTQTVINQAYIDHPELNAQSETYDAVLVGKINRMNAAYRAEGMAPEVALQTAISDFVAAPVAAAPEVGKVDVAARARNAKAQAGQPPALGGVGMGERAAAAKVDVSNMTDAEYLALPEREKKRLRGD